jgi:hypothetical protein
MVRLVRTLYIQCRKRLFGHGTKARCLGQGGLFIASTFYRPRPRPQQHCRPIQQTHETTTTAARPTSDQAIAATARHERIVRGLGRSAAAGPARNCHRANLFQVEWYGRRQQYQHEEKASLLYVPHSPLPPACSTCTIRSIMRIAHTLVTRRTGCCRFGITSSTGRKRLSNSIINVIMIIILHFMQTNHDPPHEQTRLLEKAESAAGCPSSTWAWRASSSRMRWQRKQSLSSLAGRARPRAGARLAWPA